VKSELFDQPAIRMTGMAAKKTQKAQDMEAIAENYDSTSSLRFSAAIVLNAIGY
jgi:hypothetical protein